MSFRFRPQLESMDDRIVPSIVPPEFPPIGDPSLIDVDVLAALTQYQAQVTVVVGDLNTIFDFITDIDAKEAELTAITFMLATADPYTQLMYSSYLQYLNESISDLKTVLAGTYSQFLQDYQTTLNQHGTLVLLLPPDLADQLPPPPFYTIPEGYLPPTGPGV